MLHIIALQALLLLLRKHVNSDIFGINGLRHARGQRKLGLQELSPSRVQLWVPSHQLSAEGPVHRDEHGLVPLSSSYLEDFMREVGRGSARPLGHPCRLEHLEGQGGRIILRALANQIEKRYLIYLTTWKNY